MLTFLDSTRRAREVSVHPPHLIDSDGSLTPAALIPFCAYQTNMTLLSQPTQYNLTFDICSGFKPTLLEGQLCYSMDLSMIDLPETKEGLQNGLVLILDPGTNMEKKETQIRHQQRGKISMLNPTPVKGKSHSYKIYLNTLSSFTDFRAGSFALSALKKMTGTKGFLNLADETKNCQIESLEDCMVKAYVEEGLNQCGCVPLALSSVFTIAVNIRNNIITNNES